MKHIILFLILTVSLIAQTSPIGTTSNIGLNQYQAGARGIAEGLNANWATIDTYWKINSDSITSLRNRLPSYMPKGGGAFEGRVFFNGSLVEMNSPLKLPRNTSLTQGYVWRTGTTDNDLLAFRYSSSAIDTLASRRWVRDTSLVPYMPKLGGTFSGSVNMGTSYFYLPTMTPALQGGLARTGTGLVTFGYGIGTADTLASRRYLRANYASTGSFVTLATDQTITGDKEYSGEFSHKRTAITHNPLATPDILTLTGGGTFYAVSATGTSNITEISGGGNGRIVVLMNASTFSIDFVVTSMLNVKLSGNFSMGQYDTLTLIYDSTSGNWIEISRSNN